MFARFVLAALLLLAPSGAFENGFAVIKEKDVQAHVEALCAPAMEGRDSPSAGLALAGDYIIERFREIGLEPPSVLAGPMTPSEGDGAASTVDASAYRRAFQRTLDAPDEKGCTLSIEREGAEPVELELGTDFVPLPGCGGRFDGEPVFLGFGIKAGKERYDDFRGGSVKGKIAVILEGEPRHKRAFDGPESSEYADVHSKIETLEDAGIGGVLVVRRVPASWRKKSSKDDANVPNLGFRHTWASWNPTTTKRIKRSGRDRSFKIPVHEITAAVAESIVGVDVLKIARKADKSPKPVRKEPEGVRVSMSAAIVSRSVGIDNVLGVVRGTDPELAGEVVIVGAHYDHVGVDPLGRIGFGADDNASGTSAMLEIAEGMATAGPRRTVLFVAFAAEEDGLLGSDAIAQDLPVPKERVVAMLNLDMVGYGSANEVVVLGTDENPDLGKVLKRAKKLKSTKLKSVITGKAKHLWERSDHYSFHKVGIPTLFFFEAPTETDNKDYHTFRDTPDKLSYDKIARTARLAYNTAWLVANDDERPSPPR